MRELASEDGSLDHMQHFRDILYTLIFFTAIFFAGKVCSRVLGLPALVSFYLFILSPENALPRDELQVGEIIVGVLLGPNFADFVPHASALKLYGEIGLNLLVIEAGLHIDIETLELVGARCLLVGVVGSLVPLLMTFGASIALGASMKEAFGVGASLTSMSTGIVLNVLKRGGMINQPVGQLIIAAAIVNEIVNLILLTELLAVIEDYETYMYILPIVIMFTLVGILGYSAVKIVPHILDHHILPLFPTSQKGNAILGIVLSLSLGLMTGCKYTGSSELLGSFLGGLCFCTDHHVHRVWEKQVKRVLTWMIRVFFACTIGFSIPIKDFWTGGVWIKAGVFLACMSGKFAIGLLSTPPTTDMMLTLAFAWGEWGEFSFIIATLAFDGGVIDKEYYNAIILAVSISIIVSPLMLERTLERTAKHAEKAIKKAMEETSTEEIGKRHNVFYCLQTRSHARWGQQSNLLSCVCIFIFIMTFRRSLCLLLLLLLLLHTHTHTHTHNNNNNNTRSTHSHST
jgi:Kef-type K+ transport system membrane component KefB